MRVACVMVRDFTVALARRDDPSLAGRPLVMGGSPKDHAEVVACSEEAARAGVGAGMTLRKALALCPEAAFLPVRRDLVASEADAVVAWLEGECPAVEAIAPGHAHVDVLGMAALSRQEDDAYLAELAEGLRLARQVPVRAAGAETVFAAHAAASMLRAPSAAVVPAGEGSFLARLPVEVLPVEPAMHTRLRLFGLTRLGDVARLPFGAIQAQFGREGARAWELANGRDESVVVPRAGELFVTEEIELPVAATTNEPIVLGTRAVIHAALKRDAVRGHAVRRADWELRLENGEVVRRRAVFREPTADAVRIGRVLEAKIARLELGAPGIAVGVTLSGLCSEYGLQMNLWRTGPRRQRELLEAIAQLNTREGEPQVFRIVEVEPWSRIPERQRALVAYDR